MTIRLQSIRVTEEATVARRAAAARGGARERRVRKNNVSRGATLIAFKIFFSREETKLYVHEHES
jgi:hypothetical protein